MLSSCQCNLKNNMRNMRREGLEPSWAYARRILSPVCLPIPPSPLTTSRLNLRESTPKLAKDAGWSTNCAIKLCKKFERTVCVPFLFLLTTWWVNKGMTTQWWWVNPSSILSNSSWINCICGPTIVWFHNLNHTIFSYSGNICYVTICSVMKRY